MTWQRSLCLIALTIALGSCHRQIHQPDVVMIVVDTLRWDHCGFNSGAPHTPFLDRLAKTASVYSQCRSFSSNTNIAMASLWTGQEPHETTVLTQLIAMPQRLETLAERFQQAGYTTYGLVTNPILSPDKGFAQGFDQYQLVDDSDSMLEHLGTLVTNDQRTPRFIYIHLMDCHFPYRPGRFAEPYNCNNFRYFNEVAQGQLSLTEMLFNPPLDTVQLATARHMYAASVRHSDHVIQQIAALMTNTWQQSAVIVSADHGESLGEHGYFFGHSLMTYETTIRVPLLVRRPNQQQGHVEELPVTHSDLHDALAAWCDGDPNLKITPKRETHLAWGHPNLGRLQPNPMVPVRGIQGARRSLFQGGAKLHLIPQPDAPAALEHYFLGQDPWESNPSPIEQISSETMMILREELLRTSPDTVIDSGSLEEDLELLRSLGYVGE